jgi:hypothetical protein
MDLWCAKTESSAEVHQKINKFDERRHPLIMPQLSSARNLVNIALIQFLRTTPACSARAGKRRGQ